MTTNSSEMSIQSSNVVFELILDKLYVNPIGSVIRELSCNAIDAHKSELNYEPYHLQKPSAENPFFIIRDFGGGLSKEDVDLKLNTLLFSTKRTCKLSTGGFGVGSKSPFAITDKYEMISYFEGIEYKYEWSKSSENTPVLTLISETPTEELGGILVKVPMKYSFNTRNNIEKAFKLLNLCTISPIVYKNYETKELDTQAVSPQDFEKVVDGVYTLPKGFSNYFRVGQAIYEVPHKLTNHSLFSLNSSSSLLIDIPIKSVKIHSSREYIIDSQENEEIISNLLNDYLLSILRPIKEDLEDLELLEDSDYSLKEFSRILVAFKNNNVNVNSLFFYNFNSKVSFSGFNNLLGNKTYFRDIVDKFLKSSSLKSLVLVNNSNLRFYTELKNRFPELLEHVDFLTTDRYMNLEEVLTVTNEFYSSLDLDVKVMSYSDFKTEFINSLPKETSTSLKNSSEYFISLYVKSVASLHNTYQFNCLNYKRYCNRCTKDSVLKPNQKILLISNVDYSFNPQILNLYGIDMVYFTTDKYKEKYLKILSEVEGNSVILFENLKEQPFITFGNYTNYHIKKILNIFSILTTLNDHCLNLFKVNKEDIISDLIEPENLEDTLISSLDFKKKSLYALLEGTALSSKTRSLQYFISRQEEESLDLIFDKYSDNLSLDYILENIENIAYIPPYILKKVLTHVTTNQRSLPIE